MREEEEEEEDREEESSDSSVKAAARHIGLSRAALAAKESQFLAAGEPCRAALRDPVGRYRPAL